MSTTVSGAARRPFPTAVVGPLDRRVLRRVPALLLPMIAVLVLAVIFVQARERSKDRDVARRTAQNVVQLQSRTIVRVVEMVTSILLYLREDPTLVGFASGEPRRTELEADYVAFCGAAPMYDQLRLLDRQGHELLCVRSDGGAPRAVPADRLEDRSTSEYFRRALTMDPSRVYVSRFELASEDGRPREPWEPVIHFATPVRDASGEVLGVLVLNYVGKSLLRLIYDSASQVPGWTALVDSAGYFLEAPAREDSWGYLRGLPPTFAARHPEAWERIRASPAGQSVGARGLYAHCRVSNPEDRSPVLSQLDLVSVCHVPLATLYARSANTLRILLGGGVLVALVLAAVAWRLAYAAALREGHERQLAASHEGLRKLSARLIEAQEDERRRISRDLHDELGQQATAIAIELKRAARSDDATEREAMLARASAATDDLLAGVHRISTSLRTSMLDDLGLAAALRATCSDFTERAGVATEVELDFQDRDVPAPVAQVVYRFVQEGLTNALKHARARSIGVRVRREAGRLAAEVRDDGVGFDPGATDGERLGLLGMRERIELVQGRFACDSSPGRGTRLSLSIPMGTEDGA